MGRGAGSAGVQAAELRINGEGLEQATGHLMVAVYDNADWFRTRTEMGRNAAEPDRQSADVSDQGAGLARQRPPASIKPPV